MRAIWAFLQAFLGVSFNMTTGEILASAVPNGLPTPYGTAGAILQSTGPSSPPAWNVVGSFIPPGFIGYFGGTLPAGWLECDGGIKNIVSFPALAAILGTTFGGDGVTTFGVPDLRGRVPIGLGSGTAPDATNWTLGRIAGAETNTLIANQMPSHSHTISANANNAAANGNVGSASGILSDHSATATGVAGGDQAHNNLQPSLGLRAIVKT